MLEMRNGTEQHQSQTLSPRLQQAVRLLQMSSLDFAALLRERLELPGASPWLIEKTAEAVASFYAELEEHGDQPRHPELRGAVRRLERLREIEYIPYAPETEVLPKTYPGRLEDGESDGVTDR